MRKSTQKEEKTLELSRKSTEKKPSKPEELLLEQITATVEQSRRRGFFSDVRATVREARPYRVYQAFLARLRQLRMIGFILKIIGYVFAFLQTGTLFLLTAALFFVILPVAILGSATVLLVARLDMRKSRRRIQPMLTDKRVYVLFAAGEFGLRSAKEMAEKADAVCLLISPYWVSPKSPDGGRFYLNLRELAPNVLLLRRYFYFHIRRKRVIGNRVRLIY